MSADDRRAPRPPGPRPAAPAPAAGGPAPRAARRPWARPLISGVVVVLLVAAWLLLGRAAPQQAPGAGGAIAAPATQATDPASGLRWVALTQLPREASDTLASIKAGPPYRYPRNDGVVYHNFNRVLPARPDGYYLEFTVVTPGSADRGPRRIIAGGPNRGQANAEWYYTPDHYNSFERIRP